MKKTLAKALLPLICVISGTLFPARSFALHKPVSLPEFKETMGLVKTGVTLTDRTNAAEHLAEMTRGTTLKRVDDQMLADLISLLDTPEDSVRASIAACLGHFGRRAKPAIPRLLQILSEDDCLYADMTASASVRPALRRIGVKPPPVSCKTGMHYAGEPIKG